MLEILKQISILFKGILQKIKTGASKQYLAFLEEIFQDLKDETKGRKSLEMLETGGFLWGLKRGVFLLDCSLGMIVKREHFARRDSHLAPEGCVG